jgi:hypothetical protein
MNANKIAVLIAHEERALEAQQRAKGKRVKKKIEDALGGVRESRKKIQKGEGKRSRAKIPSEKQNRSKGVKVVKKRYSLLWDENHSAASRLMDEKLEDVQKDPTALPKIGTGKNRKQRIGEARSIAREEKTLLFGGGTVEKRVGKFADTRKAGFLLKLRRAFHGAQSSSLKREQRAQLEQRKTDVKEAKKRKEDGVLSFWNRKREDHKTYLYGSEAEPVRKAKSPAKAKMKHDEVVALRAKIVKEKEKAALSQDDVTPFQSTTSLPVIVENAQ